MSKVSIIIPARGEKYENMSRTLDSIAENATGEYEIIIGHDGPPYEQFVGPNLTNLLFPEVVGIKTNINAMAAMATGKYLFKLDAHCSVGRGFDTILQQDMQPDWLVMPRFYVLNGETWAWQERDGKGEFYDYFYLCCPFTDPKGFRFKAGGHWKEKTQEHLKDWFADYTGLHKGFSLIPQIHGSGWFMEKERFFQLGGFPNIDPYGHAQEPIWLGMKNWMAGGKVLVNRNTWYAHLHQQGNKRGYHMDKAQEDKSYLIAAEFWTQDKWDDTWGEKKMTFEQFVDKFMPMPGWPENWKDIAYDKFK